MTQGPKAFCELLKLALDHAPAGDTKDKLQDIYDEHCDGGGVHTNTGGVPTDPPPPIKPPKGG